MKTLRKTITAKVGHISELSEDDQRLLQEAKLARDNAQAPYSHFKVGVAVRDEHEGHIHWGCNVERCSWTQTTHAEQNAIDTMVAKDGPTKIMAVGLVAALESEEINLCGEEGESQFRAIEDVLVPCGHCLQIIWENCFNDPRVKLIAARGGEVVVTTIGDALPMRFGPKELGVDYSKKRR